MEKNNKTPQHVQVPHNLGDKNKEIKMNPTDYLIYGYMRQHMDKHTYRTFISIRRLSELASVSINTVQRSIKKLKESGEIKVLDEKKGRSNIYEIQKTGKYFERFTYEFLNYKELESEEKGILMAMQQYTDKSDGQFAVTTKSKEELATNMHIGTRVLTRVFHQLEEKGILQTSSTPIIDKVTGLKKTARYIDLSLICQAMLFINKKVDEQGEQINDHDKRLHAVDKNILKMQEEINRLKEIIEKSNLKESSGFKFE
jgi:DNA-binding transcriptional regulator YhcF (GntR family)